MPLGSLDGILNPLIGNPLTFVIYVKLIVGRKYKEDPVKRNS
jgi:hypothetical protein